MIEDIKTAVKDYFDSAKQAVETKSTKEIVTFLVPISLTVIAIYAMKIRVWSPDKKPRIIRRSRRGRSTRRRRR